jgi:hypothetical protein
MQSGTRLVNARTMHRPSAVKEDKLTRRYKPLHCLLNLLRLRFIPDLKVGLLNVGKAAARVCHQAFNDLGNDHADVAIRQRTRAVVVLHMCNTTQIGVGSIRDVIWR